MNADEAQKFVETIINVTPQMVLIAKKFVLNHIQMEVREMFTLFLAECKANIPKAIDFNPGSDYEHALCEAARGISLQLALREAINSLMLHGILIPDFHAAGDLNFNITHETERNRQGFTPRVVGRGYPRSVSLSYSYAGMTNRTLTTGDLYMDAMNVSGFSEEVAMPLIEASTCFRFSLFLASVTLLGRATEAAWIETAKSIIAYMRKLGHAKTDQFNDEIVSQNSSIGAKIRETISNYRLNELKPLRDMSTRTLDGVVAYSMNVWNVRNTIHYTADIGLPADYDTTATLLIGAVPNFQALHKVKSVAEQLT